MRRKKSFEIEGYTKQFNVYELSVREIIELFQQEPKEQEEEEEPKTLKEKFEQSLLPLCGNVTFDDLYDMAPSEIEEVYGHFREVNRTFFEAARKAGLQEMIEGLKAELTKDFSAWRVSLLKRVIPRHSITDTPIS